MRIAFLGQKGLPAVGGGIERWVEEVAWRLAARGHRVTVYCRPRYRTTESDWYRGVRLCSLPAPAWRGVENVLHTGLATLAALAASHDVLHFQNIGPGAWAPLAALLGRPVAATIHALDYRQQKWGPAARAFLRAGERGAVASAGAVTVVSATLAADLRRRFRARPWYTPPGLPAVPADPAPGPIARRLGLEPGGFLLTVGRLIPDKRIEVLLAALARLGAPLALVVAGEAEGRERAYAQTLAAAAGRRAYFPGLVLGDELWWLYRNCRWYVHPSRQEGLCLAILEAMAAGAPVIAADIPENRELLADPAAGEPIGWTFRTDDEADLVRVLGAVWDDPDEARRRARRARASAARRFDWERTVTTLEAAYRHARGDRALARSRDERRSPPS